MPGHGTGSGGGSGGGGRGAGGRGLLRLAMGCCYSSEAEASDQEEETKRLLEPAASPPNKVLNGAEQSYHNLPSARTDEQAMLSSILAKTAM
ncbi:ragulator complex protein LAMTOR1 [Oxyura jamaicensis]|uniref:ragulator complex protein LAMTOR1 n=1 Tax=Oxyura jamaicensis TaxID=8884 RepID=UPI0015A632B6|nr:ragulator complex protein LAMTOR1 [Oxyura jamaicensis]